MNHNIIRGIQMLNQRISPSRIKLNDFCHCYANFQLYNIYESKNKTQIISLCMDLSEMVLKFIFIYRHYVVGKNEE